MEATRSRAIPWSLIIICGAAIVIAFGVGGLVILAALHEPMSESHIVLTGAVFTAVVVLVQVMASRRQRDEIQANAVVLNSLHHRVNDILAVQQWLAANIAAAAQRVERRADALQNGVTENNARLDEVTGELPKVANASATDVMKYVQGLIEAGDRDRDLAIAALHDELAKMRDEAKEELQACMRWVLERLGEAPR